MKFKFLHFYQLAFVALICSGLSAKAQTTLFDFEDGTTPFASSTVISDGGNKIAEYTAGNGFVKTSDPTALSIINNTSQYVLSAKFMVPIGSPITKVGLYYKTLGNNVTGEIPTAAITPGSWQTIVTGPIPKGAIITEISFQLTGVTTGSKFYYDNLKIEPIPLASTSLYSFSNGSLYFDVEQAANPSNVYTVPITSGVDDPIAGESNKVGRITTTTDANVKIYLQSTSNGTTKAAAYNALVNSIKNTSFAILKLRVLIPSASDVRGLNLQITSNSTITPSLPSNRINAITVTNGGSGYTSVPTVTVGSLWGASTPVSMGDEVVANNKVYKVITAGTTGETAPSHTKGSVVDGTATLIYCGAAATATAVRNINTNEISSITINTNGGGSAYTSVPVINITGGGGTGAAAIASLGETFPKDQWFTIYSGVMPLGATPTGFSLSSSGTGTGQTIYIDDLEVLTAVGQGTLPVKLTAFTGKLENSQAKLAWETAGEKSTSSFQVERSGGENLFTTIGAVKAAGNSSGAISYSFTDENPLIGKNYYRLKMTDLDGKFSYSTVVDVNLNLGSSLNFSVYPNPANSYVTVRLPSAAENSRIQIVDVLGRILKTAYVEKGEALAHINLSGIAGGAHQLIWLCGSEKRQSTIVVN